MILCLSDIHLGSPICQADLTLEILEKEKYDKLIICGDLLDSYNIHRLCKKQWKILSTLRKITKTKQCVFIKGNHDKDIETVSCLLGLDFKEEYELVVGEKRLLFVHGDRWDTFINKKPLLTDLAGAVYYALQKIDKKQVFTRKIKQKIKTWHNAAYELTKRVAQYSSNRYYDAVIFGHTHVPNHEYIDGVECVNLGSQCDLPINYALIDKHGCITLKTKE
jgi:putative phosphoesterase